MTIRNIISEAFRRGKANKPDPFYQKMSDDAYEGAVKMHITMNSGPEYKGVTFTDKNRATMRKHRDAGAHPSKAFSAMMNEEILDESKKTSERINYVYVTSKGPDGKERKDLHRNRGHSFRQAKKTALKSVQRMLPNHKIMKAFKKKDNEPIFEEHETVNEATLGGPKYIGTENPNNRKSRMPGVFSPFKRAANQARAEVAFNKHAVAATKAFVQRNMATLAKTTSAYAKRTKRHEQAMTAAEKVAPRDITKRGELMYEGEDIHEVSTKLVGRYLKKAVPHLMKNERHAADAYNQSGSQHEYFENKVTKRLKGIDRASRKLANEETEINEISKDLAARYVGDTSHDIVWNAMRATKHNMERDNAKVGKPSKEKELDAKYHDNEMKYHSRKVKNRQTGIDRALRRLKKD